MFGNIEVLTTHHIGELKLEEISYSIMNWNFKDGKEKICSVMEGEGCSVNK